MDRMQIQRINTYRSFCSVNIMSILSQTYKPGAWFSVLFASALQGCSTSNIITYSFEDTYQEYSDQNCSFDYVAAFKTMAENNIAVAQTRKATDRGLKEFVNNFPEIDQNQNSSCFFEAIVTVGIPFYGNAPASYGKHYYEIWLSLDSSTELMEICAGANTIVAGVPGLEGEAINHGIKTPDGYKSGYANTLRHLPICAVQRVD